MVDISPIDRLSFRIDYQTDYMTALGKQKGIKPLTTFMKATAKHSPITARSIRQ